MNDQDLPILPESDSSPSSPASDPAVPRAVPRRDLLSIKFACGVCGQHIEAPRDLFGEVMPCPSCGALHQIPDVKNSPRSFPILRPARIRPRQ
jgi:hypothetical protein